MIDLLLVAALFVLAAGVGLRLLASVGERPERTSDGWALGLPIGLGAITGGVFLLGELGALGRPSILGLLGVLAMIGLPTGLRSLPGLAAEVRSARPCWWVDLPVGVALLGTLLTSLAPVTDGDALCYHLQVPKVFLANGSLGFDPDLHETVYPLLTELLYAVTLAIRGPVACRLVQWGLGVVFAINVAAIARPILGERARWAAAVALLVPAVSNGMAAPLNDVALAAFGNAAIFAWTRWRDRPSGRGAAIVGLLAGLSLGVKYPAIVLGGLIGGAMVVEGIARGGLKRGWRDAIAFGAVAIVVGAPWYVRAAWWTGNPVYPFFRDFFGGAGLDVVLDPIKRPLTTTLPNLLAAIAPMTLDPARFDSVSHQFGPLFLLILPALLLERAPRRAWAVVALGYAFLTACLSQRQSMRFVVVAVGPLAVGVAWVASRWADRRTTPARILIGLFAGILIFEAGIAAGHARHGLGVVLGRESADAYLARREPTYRVGRWVDANLPGNARIVGQEHRGFYLPRGYAMELAHRRRTGLGTRGESAGAIVEALRSDGFTHLLLCPPDPETAVEFDPALGRLLGPWLVGRPPLYREAIVDPDGVLRRYAIYGLDDPRLAVAR